MSDSQLDKKKEVEISVPKPIKPMPTVIKPLNDKKTMTNEPKVSSPVDNDADLKSKFKAENIGRWAAKQENPFAEQNRKAQAKKQAIDKKRLKAGPIIGIVLGIICAIAAVVGLVVLVLHLVNGESEPDNVVKIEGSTSEDISKYRDILQNFYNNGGIGDVNDAIDDTLDKEENQQNANAVRYAQMSFYYNNGMYQEVIDISNEIDENTLTLEQLSGYYGALANAYYVLGDTTNSDINYDKMLSLPLGGE